jgi:hypothetical protein
MGRITKKDLTMVKAVRNIKLNNGKGRSIDRPFLVEPGVERAPLMGQVERVRIITIQR